MKIFRNITAALLAAAMMSLACACTGGRQKPLLAVAVEPQKALLQDIAGDGYEVVSLIKPGANPEGFEPTMSTRMDVDNADVLFITGLLPFEEKITRGLPADVRVCRVSDGLSLIYGTHGHHHHGDSDIDDHDGHRHSDFQADPHIWASVKNARVMAGNMLQALTAQFPADSAKFRANYSRTMQRLDSLDMAFARRLSALPENERTFAVWHPSLAYFARDYGLEQLAVGFENKEVSPRKLAEITGEAREHGVRVFFFQSDYDGRQAQTLNKAMGTRLVTVNPQNAKWEDELEKVVDALTNEPD